MTNAENQAIESGARQVEEREHLASGTTVPHDVSALEVEEQEPEGGPLKTGLGSVSLTMFEQNGQTRVRVGNAQRLAEMYEGIFESPDAANSAMLDAGILTTKQVKDATQVTGTGIELDGITAEQLLEAGLKRHGSSTL